MVLIKPAALRRAGYSATHALGKTRITTALNTEPGYRIRVEHFSALGFSAPGFELHAHAMPAQADLDGLLGLSFLRLLDYTVYSRRGAIAVAHAS